MQKKHWLLSLLVLLSSFATAKPVDSIVAKIGSSIITYQEILQFSKRQIMWKKIEGEPIPETGNAVFKDAFNELKQRTAIDYFAKNNGITVSPAEINQSIKFIADQNSLELKDFITSIEQSIDNGYQFLQANIKYQFFKSKIYNQILKKNNHIEQKEIDKLLKTKQFHPYIYQLQYIKKHINSFLDDNNSKTKKKQLLRNIIEQFKTRQSFEKLANRHSDAFQHKTNWLSFDEIPKPFQNYRGSLVTNTFTIVEEQDNISLYRINNIQTKHKLLSAEYKIRVLEMDSDQLIAGQTSQEKMSEIANILEKAPEKFEELIKLWSNDIFTASQNGITDWLKKEQLPTPIYEALGKMKLQQISKPLQTSEKIYIIQLIDKQSVDQFLPLQQRQAQDYLEEQVAQQITQQWLDDLVEQSTRWVDSRFQN